MHISFPARRCAPYSVFSGGNLVGVAPTLVALYNLLSAESSRLEQERARLTAARARTPEVFRFARPVPNPPTLTVIDNRGRERPEFRNHWGILWFFECKLHNLATAVDHGWDGDHRPRGAPIPGTGRRTGSYGRLCYRRPKTQSQRRKSFIIAEEGEPEFRGARKMRSLPSFWDDLPRRSWRDRSWKCFRGTQWKA